MRRAGVTLIEVVVGMALFTIVAIVMAAAVKEGATIWGMASGGSTVAGQLRSARVALSEDLSRTSFADIRTTQVPGSLGGGYDGDAVWFLSCWDPNTQQYLRNSDGTPYWQSNILYYLVVPKGYASLYGNPCIGGTDANGYDDQCPYKVLVRAVIKVGFQTNSDGNTEEPLLPSVKNYLRRPNKFSLGPVTTQPSVQSARIQAHNLLYFRVQLAPNPSYPDQVLIDLRATDASSARKQIAVGSVSLGTSRFTTQQLFSIVPSLR